MGEVLLTQGSSRIFSKQANDSKATLTINGKIRRSSLGNWKRATCNQRDISNGSARRPVLCVIRKRVVGRGSDHNYDLL